MNYLFLPVAPPAAGKSFTAQKMVDKGLLYPEDVVEPDYYRELLTGDRANQKVNKSVFDIVNNIVFTRLRYGFDVYLDATNINSTFRISLLDKISEMSEQPQIIVLISKLSRDVLDKRNEKRVYPVPQHVLKGMWDKSQKLQIQTLATNYGAKVFTLDEAQQWDELP